MIDSSIVPLEFAGDRLPALLAQARQGNQQQLGQLLQCYRGYLTILAASQLDARLRKRISSSDLVQEAMFGACRDFAQFRGGTEPELLAWLRRILLNCLGHAYKTHLRARRRDLRREVSLDAMAENWSGSLDRLAGVLEDSGSTPSGSLKQQERAVAIANQLACLPPDYRDVVVLRNLESLSFDEVARRMDRSPGAVRMLWLRALKALRKLYNTGDSPSGYSSRQGSS
jgi:RNA polymerase sigma-70 factor (ECF subfamily)